MKETAADREDRMMRAAAARRGDRPATPGRLAVRTKPVRTTVDLHPELHRQLKRWASDASETLDATDVPTAEVIRALLRLLLEDDHVNDAVLERLREALNR